MLEKSYFTPGFGTKGVIWPVCTGATLSEYNFAIYCCFRPPVVQICFFYSSRTIVKIHLFCVGISIGNLPETRYFLLAFYRYFRENSDSVIFLRPWWQPCMILLGRWWSKEKVKRWKMNVWIRFEFLWFQRKARRMKNSIVGKLF